MPTKIFVGNLSADTQSDDIRSLFEKYGSVVECDVLNRYGFVHMANEQEAMNAIDGISGLDVHGFKINVELSRSKPRKPGFGDRAGGGGFGDRGRGRGRGGMRGGGRGMGRGMGRGGPPGAGGPRRPYDPYPPVDRYDRYDRYDDYYRGYDRARPYPDPYERERRLPGERPLPPMYDRRPLAGARLTPPTDTYRRPPPEYYDRGAYGAGYETRRELPGQLPPRDPMGDMAARERDPYLSREREYAMADRGDPMRPLPARDPYARERELTGNGYDYRRSYESSQTSAYGEYPARASYGESAYASTAATSATAGYAGAHETYRDPYAGGRTSAQDAYGSATTQASAGGTKMDQSFLAKGPIFF